MFLTKAHTHSHVSVVFPGSYIYENAQFPNESDMRTLENYNCSIFKAIELDTWTRSFQSTLSVVFTAH